MRWRNVILPVPRGLIKLHSCDAASPNVIHGSRFEAGSSFISSPAAITILSSNEIPSSPLPFPMNRNRLLTSSAFCTFHQLFSAIPPSVRVRAPISVIHTVPWEGRRRRSTFLSGSSPLAFCYHVEQPFCSRGGRPPGGQRRRRAITGELSNLCNPL